MRIVRFAVTCSEKPEKGQGEREPWARSPGQLNLWQPRIFPNDAAAFRLITAVVVDQHDEWTVSERRYLSQEAMDQLKVDELRSAPVALANVK